LIAERVSQAAELRSVLMVGRTRHRGNGPQPGLHWGAIAPASV